MKIRPTKRETADPDRDEQRDCGQNRRLVPIHTQVQYIVSRARIKKKLLTVPGRRSCEAYRNTRSTSSRNRAVARYPGALSGNGRSPMATIRTRSARLVPSRTGQRVGVPLPPISGIPHRSVCPGDYLSWSDSPPLDAASGKNRPVQSPVSGAGSTVPNRPVT